MPIEFAKTSAVYLASLPKSKTVFFFPVGPLEDHGPHLPLGLDLDEAYDLCNRAAQKLERELPSWVGVIMPPAPLGIDSNTTLLAITVRPHVLRDWLVDACRSLVKSGFLHFVCFTGSLGPKQLTAIEEAGKMIQKSGRWGRWAGSFSRINTPKPTLISANSALISWEKVLASPFWPDPEEHGGQRDTSVALVIDKGLVDPEFATLPKMERESSRWLRNLGRRLGRIQGYWGNPGGASVEAGEKEINDKLNEVFPKMRAVWEGANPAFLFRSWYSILPPNKSFFKAWLLLVIICLVMAAWGLLSAWMYQIN